MRSVFERIMNAIAGNSGLTKMFLDYDGTLVDLTSQPELAVPSQELLALLNSLKRKIPLYLVTGRDLDGMLSLVGYGFNIIAMHGSEFVSEEGKRWYIENFENYRDRTKELSAKYLHLEKEFPGLRIIDKHGGLQFHYFNVDRGLTTRLKRVISKVKEEGFEMYSGKYVFELRIKGVNKGAAMLKYMDGSDFILFAGDDRTDEEAFRVLGGQITIKVGEGKTAARFRIDSPAKMKMLLYKLVQNPESAFRREK
jgi:trehalose 6-phosphate phosphatase